MCVLRLYAESDILQIRLAPARHSGSGWQAELSVSLLNRVCPESPREHSSRRSCCEALFTLDRHAGRDVLSQVIIAGSKTVERFACH